MILVNLTCGRNPWKRASIEDATFRAYLRNSRFLSSILPLSPELDVILRRIFDCDPTKRISVEELRELVLRCPQFTTQSSILPPSPPCEPEYTPQVAFGKGPTYVEPFQRLPYTPAPSPPAQPITAQYSHLTSVSTDSSPSDDGSVFSTSSSSSSYSEFEEFPKPNSLEYVVPGLSHNYYGNIFPSMDWVPKPLVHQAFVPSVQVY